MEGFWTHWCRHEGWVIQSVQHVAVEKLLNVVDYLSSNSHVLDLVQTAVTISHILYSPPSERTPRNVLRLYNVCWLHHELCLYLFPSLIGTGIIIHY